MSDIFTVYRTRPGPGSLYRAQCLPKRSAYLQEICGVSSQSLSLGIRIFHTLTPTVLQCNVIIAQYMLSSFLEKSWLRDCGLISPCFQFLDCSQDGSWWRSRIWWWQPCLVLPLVPGTLLHWLPCGRLLCWLVHSHPALRCLYRWP